MDNEQEQETLDDFIILGMQEAIERVDKAQRLNTIVSFVCGAVMASSVIGSILVVHHFDGSLKED